MSERNIELTEHHARFVAEQVETGKYKDASDVLRAGLRLLEQQTQADEQTLTLLKKLAVEGFDSLDQGKGLSFTGDKALANVIAQIGQKAASVAARRAAE